MDDETRTEIIDNYVSRNPHESWNSATEKLKSIGVIDY